jgi:hypothetical protein
LPPAPAAGIDYLARVQHPPRIVEMLLISQQGHIPLHLLDALSDGSRMTGGLTYRNGIPFGTWQDRFIEWFRDLGFLQKSGIETKASRDIATFVTQPQRGNAQH